LHLEESKATIHENTGAAGFTISPWLERKGQSPPWTCRHGEMPMSPSKSK
jgi:hypothetical protein